MSMFHNIPQVILDRMQYLESIDARDRVDGTPRSQRLRQIPPETGCGGASPVSNRSFMPHELPVHAA